MDGRQTDKVTNIQTDRQIYKRRNELTDVFMDGNLGLEHGNGRLNRFVSRTLTVHQRNLVVTTWAGNVALKNLGFYGFLLTT